MFCWETLGLWYTPHSQILLQIKNIQRHPPMGQHNLPHCRYSTRVALRTWKILRPPNVQYHNLNNHLIYQNKSKPWRPHLKESAANTRHHRTAPEVTARSPLRVASSQLFHIWSDTELVRWVLGGLPLEIVMIAENLCAAWLKMNAKHLHFFINKTENEHLCYAVIPVK